MAALAKRHDGFWCPECDADVILKRGTEVVPHFAHKAYTGCPMSEGESMRHLDMKLQVGALFGEADYEVRYGAERRADVVLGGRIVVECQASAIGIEEVEARTRFYNALDLPVLWVFDMGRLAGDNTWCLSIDSIRTLGEVRVPAEMRWLHRKAYGFLYIMDPHGRMYGCHLAAPWARDNASAGYPSMPRTLRQPKFHRAGTTPAAFWSSDRLFRFVRCGERVWWRQGTRW